MNNLQLLCEQLVKPSDDLVQTRQRITMQVRFMGKTLSVHFTAGKGATRRRGKLLVKYEVDGYVRCYEIKYYNKLTTNNLTAK